MNAFVLWGINLQIIYGIPLGDKPMSDTGLLLTGGLLWLVVILFFSLKLETHIYENRIEVRFFPLQLKTAVYYWDDIASAELRTYAPLKEYGGWGLRYSLCGYGKALNVSGNQGLQLVFKDGKKLLIGTRKREVLAYVLEQIKKD